MMTVYHKFLLQCLKKNFQQNLLSAFSNEIYRQMDRCDLPLRVDFQFVPYCLHFKCTANAFFLNFVILEFLDKCSCPDCLREMGRRRREETGRCQVLIFSELVCIIKL